MKNIWLIGAGYMAQEYAKVLKAQGHTFQVIGRGEDRVRAIEAEYGAQAISGGLAHFLAQAPPQPDFVINAVGIEGLAETTEMLLAYGIKNILLEKPGVGYVREFKTLVPAVAASGAKVVLAYNRRFYASVLKAEEIIRADGGVESFNFEFTEWAHVIGDLEKTDAEHQNWLLGNSTHLIDMAFFLGGFPAEMHPYHAGADRLAWHQASSKYAGAGRTEGGAFFSYIANWTGPGRWWIEMVTPKRRLVFRPIEKLQVQAIGSVAVNPVEGVDYSLDEAFKPGVYRQTEAFLNEDFSRFCDVATQYQYVRDYYVPMSGYSLD